ncbi:MAG: secretin N-terminal domain-containing protein [Candidatus Omnitrophota bacterium]|nr:secretin N-terminal domain-containing protein [Candidatus Omnitrophota bacterium]
MKKRILTTIIVAGMISLIMSVLLPAISYSQSETRAGTPAGISMDFQDANLKDVLKVFSQQSGLNFIASEEVKDRRVTLYLDNVSIQDVLDNIIEANELTYEQALGSDIFIVSERVKPEIETITKVYTLNYYHLLSREELEQLIKASEIDSGDEGSEETDDTEAGGEALKGEDIEIVYTLKQLLTKRVNEGGEEEAIGKISVDRRTNSLIITDIPANFEIIEATITKLDVPIPEIMVEVEVIETELYSLEQLGFKWGDSGEVFSFNLDDADIFLPVNYGKWHASLITGTLGLGNIQTALEMLVSEGKARVLARPRILLLSNEAAVIDINSNDAIQKTTEWSYPDVGPARETVVFERAVEDERPGVSLKVTAMVNKDSLIKMLIEPKVITKVLSDISTEDDVVYDLHFRTAKSTVMVGDGQTIIIGGLISKNNDEDFERIPFLGDIPVLGNLFKYKRIENTDTELIFFITPHILGREAIYSEVNQPKNISHPLGLSAPKIQKRAKPGQETYKPSKTKAEIQKEFAIGEAIRQFLAERAMVKAGSESICE